MKNLKQEGRKPFRTLRPEAIHRRKNLIARFFKEHWDILLIVGAVALLYSMLPLGTAIRFGGDEGYELIKGFLVSKGFKLYQQIWCDQTPLFPMMLNWAFRIFEPSLLVARLVAASFGLVLFGAFFQLVKQSAGRISAFIATFLLIASPIILELSVSVMQEVPAFAIGLLSILLLFRWGRKLETQWLIASGILMGVALGIKVTVGLLVPAAIAEIVFAQRTSAAGWLKAGAANTCWWLASLGTSFGLILLLWGAGSIRSTWQTQSLMEANNGLGTPADFPISLPLLRNHYGCILAVIVGLYLILSLRHWRNFIFPMALLVTAFGVHLIHRPFWDYYYLHLAIPMTWIGGFAFEHLISKVFYRQSDQGSAKSHKNHQFTAFASIIFAAFVLVRTERRLEVQINELQRREQVQASKLLAEIKNHASKTHWIYTQEGMEQYAFEAGLPMPPEIAVISLKRFWSGQIRVGEIVDTCQKYKPEQLLLPSSNLSSAWQNLLANYTNTFQDAHYTLYVKKELK